MIKVFKHYNVLTIVSLSLIISIVAIVSAWIIEFFAGYEPCELCLIQRIPYYIGIPLAAASIFAIISGFKRYLTAIILFISCVLMLANFNHCLILTRIVVVIVKINENYKSDKL